ncbi:nitrate ABC transporter ATP-binding protein [Helicobacter sp. MIT 00-7814]|nr:nitrate ABC transporter ATP-binding protein [Helicobacter sp. MIT 99-10781]RDU55577.1 nitrate ABC transporter ATP-binding protein [Helicobacter sp. MIT 00-7814]
MMSAIIQINDCSKSFGAQKVLDSINLDIQKGEFITLLGASGCGKSTLLNLIGGFERFDSGEIIIENTRYTKQCTPKSCIKIFQDYALLEWKSALENVMFALQAQGVEKKLAKKRAQEYLELTHLQGFENRYPRELSGGQKQRVALARALSVQPKILLLDEPFSALDNFTRNSLQEELLKISKDLGTTFIFVTHDIEEAIFLGSRVIVLSPVRKSVIADIEVNINKTERNSLEFLNLKREIAWLLKAHRFSLEYVI